MSADAELPVPSNPAANRSRCGHRGRRRRRARRDEDSRPRTGSRARRSDAATERRPRECRPPPTAARSSARRRAPSRPCSAGSSRSSDREPAVGSRAVRGRLEPFAADRVERRFVGELPVTRVFGTDQGGREDLEAGVPRGRPGCRVCAAPADGKSAPVSVMAADTARTAATLACPRTYLSRRLFGPVVMRNIRSACCGEPFSVCRLRLGVGLPAGGRCSGCGLLRERGGTG